MPSDQWANDGNTSINLRLVRADDDDPEPFQPDMTYALLANEEQIIYGYKDLDVSLSFASGSLASYLSIKYSAKLPASSSVKPDDIEGTLYKWLPADYLKSEEAFAARVKEDAKQFKPYGQRIASYARRPVAAVAEPSTNGKGKGKATIQDEDESDEDDEPRQRWEDCAPGDEGAIEYEAWHATMTTPEFRQYLRRMQIFIPLYIEGGEYIDEEDERWEFVVLYERERPADGHDVYHFVGYTSLYPYLYWPSSTRMRLAQFIIVPPFQGAGHGARLYSLVYLWLLSRPEIAELTIEDPSEAFQDLRDKADLNALLSKDVTKTVAAPVDRDWSRKVQREMKLADRQFARLVEMALLLHNNDADGGQPKAYRLMVKERLYRFNYDVLAQMEKGERRDLLKTTYEGLIEDYTRLTAGFRGAINGAV